jgi:hypothetical protein
MFAQQLRPLRGRTIVASEIRPDAGGKMKMRVLNVRVGAGVMLLAAFLLISGAVTPVLARVDMSVGEAGDPTDGNGIESGGGSSIDNQRPSADQPSPGTTESESRIVYPEIVLVFNGVVCTFFIHRLFNWWRSQ